MGTKGARRIANALKQNTTLRGLDIQRNGILHDGERAMRGVMAVAESREKAFDETKTLLLLGLSAEESPLALLDRDVMQQIVSRARPDAIKIVF